MSSTFLRYYFQLDANFFLLKRRESIRYMLCSSFFWSSVSMSSGHFFMGFMASMSLCYVDGGQGRG